VFGLNLGLRLRGRTCPVLGPDMFGNRFWNPVIGPDKFGKRLSHYDKGVDQTCLIQEPDMFDKSYKNPATDPDKSRGLRKLEWPGHVWARGWTCLILLTGIQLGNRIYPYFLGSWIVRCFLIIYTSPTHSMHPP
jgi:hypothetical protein